MSEPLAIDYYSDILCVWAWIAQRRVDELNETLAGRIELRHYYVDIFGDVPTKMETQWKARGGYEAYADHVLNAASGFQDAPVNPDAWRKVRPATSANAHLVLKAVEISYDQCRSASMAPLLRKAFFVDAQDIGKLEVLTAFVKAHDCDPDLIHAQIESGAAMAALMSDYQKSRQEGVKGSPSYVIDGGRQTLYGNVGYRVLRANIDELLKHPQDEASWC